MSESSKPSTATTLVQLVESFPGLELFHNPDGDPFVSVPTLTHRETYPLRGSGCRRWLARLYYQSEGKAPGSQGLADALNVLEGGALYNGEERPVHMRLAAHDGHIYLDLADEYWQAVRITKDGWEIDARCPVHFWRSRGMRPLPRPQRGGNIGELRRFVNVSDADWTLLLAWLVAAFRPTGPYPVLLVHGEQGSAKSTLVRIARSLIDPSEAPVRREPRDGRDLVVAARNSWVVAFDNVSYLPRWLSDDMARLSTGIGFSSRQLYTDMDEVIVNVSRPLVLNGIEEVASRGDLLDRGLVLSLPTIEAYQDEEEFWGQFDAAHPRILGALLDAVVYALAYADRVEREEIQHLRMADFARWAVAAEPALGLRAGEFLSTYETNRGAAVQLTLDSSLLSTPLELIAEQGFKGTASDLLDQLASLVSEDVPRKKGWPSAPNVLSGQLRRLAPALRRNDVVIEWGRAPGGSRTKVITVRRGTGNTVPNRPDRPDEDDSRDDGTVRDGQLQTSPGDGGAS